MLCLVVSGPSFEEVYAQISSEQEGIGRIELRLDLLDDLDFLKISILIRNARVPVMLTLRPKREGGAFLGTEQERLDILLDSVSLGPEWVDIEKSTPDSFLEELLARSPQLKILRSVHDFDKTPSYLEQFLDPKADAIKIACYAKSSLDALRLLNFARQHEQVIPVAMGEYGQFARVLAPMSYVTLSSVPSLAPGILTRNEMLNTYYHGSHGPDVSIYALLGDPVEQSLGHQFHNQVFQDKQVNALYVKIRIQKDELAEFWSYANHFNFQGFSITMPLKEAIIPHLDEIDAQALAIGAVNTVTLRAGKWVGSNTDASGAADAIEDHCSLEGKNVLILGAGGASKALVYEALRRGAQVRVLNRTQEKARLLAENLSCEYGSLDDVQYYVQQGCDILVNGTSLEMPVSESSLHKKLVVMDMKYGSNEGALIQLARSVGCQVVPGIAMFRNQAVAQSVCWLESCLSC